ncbi:hypothetical protein E2C01_090003 [Portunus trituberculatus]|uniref:Uncharacterized protein n=1 Tax=Portunus trituberculatus TaxID=210409 RepID=A0A5B7JNY4_PORTR|nr:hypothetical protein [Portunus trituberculatus]
MNFLNVDGRLSPQRSQRPAAREVLAASSSNVTMSQLKVLHCCDYWKYNYGYVNRDCCPVEVINLFS